MWKGNWVVDTLRKWSLCGNDIDLDFVNKSKEKRAKRSLQLVDTYM